MELPLPVALVLPPHHVAALISGRDSERPYSRQAAANPPSADIFGRQVKRGKPTGSGSLTGRGHEARREMESLARTLPAGSCRLDQGEMSLPGNWP